MEVKINKEIRDYTEAIFFGLSLRQFIFSVLALSLIHILDKKVKRSGLNREAYLRQLISGVVPRDAPPPDYYSMMRELHKIGNNLNQIAQKAHVLNVVDVQRYDKEVRKFNEAVRKITEAVILPEKNESWQ